MFFSGTLEEEDWRETG